MGSPLLTAHRSISFANIQVFAQLELFSGPKYIQINISFAVYCTLVVDIFLLSMDF